MPLKQQHQLPFIPTPPLLHLLALSSCHALYKITRTCYIRRPSFTPKQYILYSLFEVQGKGGDRFSDHAKWMMTAPPIKGCVLLRRHHRTAQ